MSTEYYGQRYVTGGQSTIAGYTVDKQTDNEPNVDKTEVLAADGQIEGIHIARRNLSMTLELTARYGYDPLTDFPAEAPCALAGDYYKWWVDSAPRVRSKDPWKVTVKMTCKGAGIY